MFTYYIESDWFHLKYAGGSPSATGREFHDYDEIVLFLNGDSQLISKDTQAKLSPQNMILIPKEHFHQFCVVQPEHYTRCILGFREAPELKPLIREVMREVTVLSAPSEIMLALFTNMMNAANSDRPVREKQLLIQSTLPLLLLELKQATQQPQQKNTALSELIQAVLQYVDEHFSQTITVGSIAAHFYISPSTLAHRFRSELNISVYRYLSEKRMSMMRQYVESGLSLSHAAQLCGYHDYSNFYKIYKKQYGITPSQGLLHK